MPGAGRRAGAGLRAGLPELPEVRVRSRQLPPPPTTLPPPTPPSSSAALADITNTNGTASAPESRKRKICRDERAVLEAHLRALRDKLYKDGHPLLQLTKVQLNAAKKAMEDVADVNVNYIHQVWWEVCGTAGGGKQKVQGSTRAKQAQRKAEKLQKERNAAAKIEEKVKEDEEKVRKLASEIDSAAKVLEDKVRVARLERHFEPATSEELQRVTEVLDHAQHGVRLGLEARVFLTSRRPFKGVNGLVDEPALMERARTPPRQAVQPRRSTRSRRWCGTGAGGGGAAAGEEATWRRRQVNDGADGRKEPPGSTVQGAEAGFRTEIGDGEAGHQRCGGGGEGAAIMEERETRATAQLFQNDRAKGGAGAQKRRLPPLRPQSQQWPRHEVSEHGGTETPEEPEWRW
ncbi:hypothetical protein NFJ02_02g72090 [Pycnococcus provasolii]